MILGGFLWQPCRMCSVVLEILILKKKVEKKNPQTGTLSLSGNKVCSGIAGITVTAEGIPEFLVPVGRIEIFFPKNQPQW